MIIVNLDVELAKKKMRSGELAERIGITQPISRFLRQARPRQSVLQHWTLFVRS